MPTRQEIINYAFEHKISPEGTNKVLGKYNQKPMGIREESLYRTGTWGTSPIGRLGRDAREFMAGINTAMTMGAEYGQKLLTKPSQTLNETASNINQYAREKGIGGAVGDLASLMGAPYGLTREDIQQRGLGNAIKTVPGYMWAHPGFTTLDVVLPAMGKAPSHQVGDLLEKVKAPQTIRDFIPSTNISKVNEAINTGRGVVSSNDRAMIRQLAEATNMKDVDMGMVARNLQAPIKKAWQGNEATLKATQKLKEIAKRYDEELYKLGVSKDTGKTLAQAQYIMEKVNPSRLNNIIVEDAIKKLNDRNYNIRGLSTEKFNRLAEEANNLYNQGLIYPLTHKATYKYNPNRPGLVTGEDKALGALAMRHHGWATPEELAPTLFKGYEQTAREIYDANVGKISLDNIAQSVGKKTTLENLRTQPLRENEIVISPRAYNDILREDFGKGEWGTTKTRVNELSQSGLSKNVWNKYGDDLYRINKDNLRPLVNMVNARGVKNPFRKLMSYWKTAQLITPKYVIENRLGNWALNATEGVLPSDYLDAMNFKFGNNSLYKGKYNTIRPDRLKADTSYYGVLGEEFQGTGATQAFKQGVGTIYQGTRELNPKKIYKGLFDTFSAPVLSLESQLEGLDRYANFIRQAKRLSSKTGESVESIIKRSSKDNALYNQLMGKVNRSLGDYVGRNWAIDPTLYENLTTAFPFSKYPTQAVRTLTHQAMQRPLNFAGVVTLPERIGAKKWNELVKQYPELEREEGGLVDYKVPGRNGYIHIHQSDTNPLGAGAGLISNILQGDWQNINISPIFSLSRLANFQDRFGNPASSPQYFNYAGKQYRKDYTTGRPIPEEARPTFGDKLSYAGSWYGNNFVPPVIAWNRVLGPLGATILNNTWYQNYDTSLLGQIGEGKVPSWLQPLVAGKTDKPGKKYPDTILNQFGIRTMKVYPKQNVSGSTYKSMMKKYFNNQRNKTIKEE